MKKGVAVFALATAFLWTVSQESLAEGPGAMGARDDVARATSVRMLQSELMVAALACHGELRVALVENYNHFVHQFSPALVRSADTLRGHFRQAYGARHQIRFDSFLTHLANQASLNSVREAEYCESRAQLAEAALGIKGADLENFTFATYRANLAALANDVPPRDRRLAARKTPPKALAVSH